MNNRYYKKRLRKQIAVYKNRVLLQKNLQIQHSDVECEPRGEILVESGSEEDHLDNQPDQQINYTFKDKLKKWFHETKPTRKCLEKLLIILKEEGIDVPTSAQGLLGKNQKIKLRSVLPGNYYHLGIETQLKKVEDVLKKYEKVILDINIDGILLFESSRMELYPILMKIVNTKETIRPLVVGVYAGRGKPLSVEDYLKEFVEEVKVLNGHLHLGEKTIGIEFMCLICDTPAIGRTCPRFWVCVRLSAFLSKCPRF